MGVLGVRVGCDSPFAVAHRGLNRRILCAVFDGVHGAIVAGDCAKVASGSVGSCLRGRREG